MGTKVITNKDGKMETITVPDPDPNQLAELHKELRDMLDGNTQFHDDPYKQPEVPLPEVTESLPFDPELWNSNYGV